MGSVVQIQDENGELLNPATQALEEALSSKGGDELRVDLSPSEPIDVTAEDVPTALQSVGGTAQSGVDIASKIDAIAQALVSGGGDAIRTRLVANAAGTLDTDLQSPVKLENGSSTKINPATEDTLTALAQALASNGGDKLQTSLSDPIPAGSNEIGKVQVSQLPELPQGDQHIGTVDVKNIKLPAALHHGEVTIDQPNASKPLAGSQVILGDGVEIRAPMTNDGNVYIGDSQVTRSDGHALPPERVIFVKIDDLSKIHVDADNGGDSITYIAT